MSALLQTTLGGGRTLAVGVVLCVLEALSGMGCGGPPAILYELRSTPSDKAQPGPRNRTVLEFDKGRMLRFSESGGGIKIDVIFLKKENLRDIAERIQGERGVLHRTPEIQPIRVHCYNYSDREFTWDLYLFRIKNLETGAVILPIRMQAYLQNYYGRGSSGLPFYWAFEQKDSFQFLHRLPDWYARLNAADTSSPAERRGRTVESVQHVETSHAARTRLSAGREIKGYILFPELDRGPYALEYADPSPSAVPFAPFSFNVKLTYEPEEDTHAPAAEKADKDAARLFQAEILDVDRELSELHKMHDQLHFHDELREKAKAAPDTKRGPHKPNS